MQKREGIFSAKGQASIEYILVIAFTMLFSIPLIIVFFTQSDDLIDTISMIQAKKITERLAQSAEEIYYQGAPAQYTFLIYFPLNVDSIVIGNHEVNFVMDSGNGVSDVYSVSAVNVTGTITPSSGIKKIRIKAEPDIVNITQIG